MGGGVGYGSDILLNMLLNMLIFQQLRRLSLVSRWVVAAMYPGTAGWCGGENQEQEGCKHTNCFLYSRNQTCVQLCAFVRLGKSYIILLQSYNKTH